MTEQEPDFLELMAHFIYSKDQNRDDVREMLDGQFDPSSLPKTFFLLVNFIFRAIDYYYLPIANDECRIICHIIAKGFLRKKELYKSIKK